LSRLKGMELSIIEGWILKMKDKKEQGEENENT